jgi:hypothetical protein
MLSKQRIAMYNVMYTSALCMSGMVIVMTQMIRKQIYIGKTQQLLLARLAEARGLSESEVIRQAIEHEAIGGHIYDTVPDTGSLDQIIQFALSRRAAGVSGEPLHWKREDAYSERLERYGRPDAR